MTESIADILERAADRLSKPDAWTQGALARDANGEKVEPESPAAVCWCLSGALMAEIPIAHGEDFCNAIDALERVLPGSRIVPLYNDRKSRRKSQVVAKLREAAAKARTLASTGDAG